MAGCCIYNKSYYWFAIYYIFVCCKCDRAQSCIFLLWRAGIFIFNDILRLAVSGASGKEHCCQKEQCSCFFHRNHGRPHLPLLLIIYRRNHFHIFLQHLRSAMVISLLFVHSVYIRHLLISEGEVEQIEVGPYVVRVLDPGITTSPFWICHLRIIWALDLPYFSPSFAKSGSAMSVLSPWPSGYYACITIS